MNLAVIQMVSGADVPTNLRSARGLLEQAAAEGARLAVLPENFAAMGYADLAALGRLEAQGDGPVLPWLRRTARELGLWIVAGTLPLPPDDRPTAKPRACSLLIDAHGERVARYDKLHLFDVAVGDARGSYRESADFDPGEHLVVAQTPVGRLGLTVCYDLRFAELYAALRERGAELISAPAAFTAVTGAAHWEVLIRARAIETQCYLLAAGQGGEHPGPRETHGHSAIVDPWGVLHAAPPRGEGLCLARRDAQAQAGVRQNMPVHRHRRFSVSLAASRAKYSE